MYNDKFLFNYMFLRSKPKRFLSRSKAASLAFQSSAFAANPVGGFLSANNLFEKEKNEKLKKRASAERDYLVESLREIPAIDEAFIKTNVANRNKRLLLAKAKGIGIGSLLNAAEKEKVREAGGFDKLSYNDIKEKLKF